MDRYILISTDGYSIENSTYETLERAQREMREAYARSVPENWYEECRTDSYCANTNAILYSNWEDVYVWKIITVR